MVTCWRRRNVRELTAAAASTDGVSWASPVVYVAVESELRLVL